VTVLAGSVALLLSIGLLCARRIGTIVPLCALQSLCAGAALGRSSMTAALLVVALNGVGLPLAVARLDDGVPLAVRGNVLLSWVAALATLGLAEPVFAASGTGVVALGLLLIAVRVHPLASAIGLLSAQNGAALVASAQAGLALPTVLAVAVPLLPALALTDQWLRR
jgi:hypothetical protein